LSQGNVVVNDSFSLSANLPPSVAEISKCNCATAGCRNQLDEQCCYYAECKNPLEQGSCIKVSKDYGWTKNVLFNKTQTNFPSVEIIEKRYRLSLKLIDNMDQSKKEFIKRTPKPLFILPVLFVVAALVIMVYPIYGFALSALILMLLIHSFVNFPAISRKEEPFYEKGQCGFFDMKVRFSLQLWAVGILLMIVLPIIGMIGEWWGLALPEIDLTSIAIIFIISLLPFIPATFVLMKASYLYDDSVMRGITMIILIIMAIFAIAFGIYGYGAPDGNVFVPFIPDIKLIPYLPLSICALAISLLISYYFIKSAKNPSLNMLTAKMSTMGNEREGTKKR